MCKNLAWTTTDVHDQTFLKKIFNPTLGLFGSAFGHQTLRFSVLFCKNHPNQYECRIHQVITTEGIRRFLNHKLYMPLYLPPHTSPMISRFSWQLDYSQTQILRKTLQEKICTKHAHYCFKHNVYTTKIFRGLEAKALFYKVNQLTKATDISLILV